MLGSVKVRKHMNSRVKTLSGVKPCICSGNVAISALARLDLAKLPTKSAQDLDLHFKMLYVKRCQKTDVEHVRKMRSAKCVSDSSGSSISHKNRKKDCDAFSYVAEPPLSMLRLGWSIWCGAPALQVCNRL